MFANHDESDEVVLSRAAQPAELKSNRLGACEYIYIYIFHKCELGREKYAEINGSQVASEEANRKMDHCGQ